MQSADMTRRLPVELLSRTLDYLELQELIPILGVCRLWRRLAIAHRTYWCFIELHSVSDGAIDLFLTRLGRSGRRPVRITIGLEVPSRRVGDEVLPVVALHLGHTEHFCLMVHEAQAAAVLDTLSWPAPMLTAVSVVIHLPEGAAGCPLLPVDLFLNDAPKLDEISLRNFRLPEVLPAVLSRIQDVLFGYTYNGADFRFIRSVFAAFPRMRRLSIDCGCLVIPPKLLLDPQLLRNLDILAVKTPPCSCDGVLAQFPCDTIPIVIVEMPTSSTITYLLDMLPSGRLNLALRTVILFPEKNFLICVHSPSNGRERAFRQAISDFRDIGHMPHDLLRRIDFCARISSLAISQPLWALLAPLLLPLPHLQKLRLFIETPLDPQAALAPGGSISCPHLRTLCIESICGVMSLSAPLLSEFTTSALRDVVLPLATLSITNVVLVGHCSPLRPLFNQIVYCSSG